jgi:hypothetical protein
MSYSWGGKQKVEEFNSTVSAFKAPKNSQYDTVPTGLTTGYKGDLYEKGTPNEGYIGATEKKKKWAGLINTEENEQLAWLKATYPGDTNQDEETRWAHRAEHEYYKGHWAGIDCMGLVLRSIAAPDSRLPSVALPDLCYNDENPCRVGGPLGSENSISNLSTTSFNLATDKYATEAYSRIGDSDKEKTLIKKGDLVLYGGHISIVYSDRVEVDKGNATYEIIHAFGGECLQRNKNTDQCLQGTFSRKVLVMPSIYVKVPTGFGRLKIWQ